MYFIWQHAFQQMFQMFKLVIVQEAMTKIQMNLEKPIGMLFLQMRKGNS